MAIPDVYKDYPEVPYISGERDVADWLARPEKYPYAIVERRQMERVKEGLLPGDIVLLWRISLGTFTSDSIYPQYFEYRYGINGPDSLALLLRDAFAYECTMAETLPIVSAPILKRILKEHGLPVGGNKEVLMSRVLEAFQENELRALIDVRRYGCTDKGKAVLDTYPEIIVRHGPKSL